VRNVAASVRQRLLNHAQQHGAVFQEHGAPAIPSLPVASSQWILAQGSNPVCGVGWSAHRPSRDVDLLGLHRASAGELIGVFREVVSGGDAGDGLLFKPSSLRATELGEDPDYPGVRLRLQATLDGAVIPLQIDVAFGQAVVPAPQDVEVPTLLEFPPLRLRAYPPEAVVAEKFEALVKLGMLNSRYKDFYDLWYLLTRLSLKTDRLRTALGATFARRRTELPKEIPETLTAAFFDDPVGQRQWNGFLDRGGIPSDARPTLAEVMLAIRDTLMPIARSLLEGGRT
jgi:Nucleotidyl transferase AbiEii toxin, Type IV TA system